MHLFSTVWLYRPVLAQPCHCTHIHMHIKYQCKYSTPFQLFPSLICSLPSPSALSPPRLLSPSPSAVVHVFPLVLGTVHASDVEGDTVTYSLLDNVTIFFVSPAGGQVAALGEVTQTYNLTVVGVDSGTPPLTGNATIQILTAGVVTHVIGTMCVCVCVCVCMY